MTTEHTYRKVELKQQLDDMGIATTDSILVHSSMKKIGDVEGGADTVLDVLSEHMADGLLMFPTHTWSYIDEKNPIFDVVHSKTCVGILTDMFRKRPHVKRSWHPTHSVAALGADAEQLIAQDHLMETPCGQGSALWQLWQHQGKILLIGVDLRSNTFIHGVEEWNDVPGRLSDEHEALITVLPDGRKINVPSRRHIGLSWSEHYWKVEDVLFERGTITEGQFGDARVLVCDTMKLQHDISRMLAVDQALFTTNDALSFKDRTTFLNLPHLSREDVY